MKKIAIAIVIASGALSANAQDKSYFEIGVANAKFTDPTIWFTSPVAFIKWGVNINDTWATELQIGKSIQDTNFIAYGVPFTARIDSMIGGYFVGSTPLDEKVSLYGRLGFTKGEASASTAYGRATASDTGLSYGGGVRFNFDKSKFFTIDYTSFYNSSGTTVIAPSLSFGSTF
jgi:hypothetical protein